LQLHLVTRGTRVVATMDLFGDPDAAMKCTIVFVSLIGYLAYHAFNIAKELKED